MAERASRKTRVGTVVGDKADKTITVEVEAAVHHQFYKKTIKRTKKFHADDRDNQAKTGDRVEIMETRPLSKNKRWRLTKIVEKAK